MECRRIWKTFVALTLFSSGIAAAQSVHPLFDLSSASTAPFPSDRFTVFNSGNLTFRQVSLPAPDCTAFPSDCQDYAVINTLDGFNIQPRLRIPFDGPIDPTSVNSSNVYLVSLGDTTHPFRGYGKVIGINQLIWEPASNVLTAESDEQLEQHTTYVLIVTNGVLDSQGSPIKRARPEIFSAGHDFDWRDAQYRAALLASLLAVRAPLSKVVAASVFTTRSVTATLESIRDQIKSTVPAPADFSIASDGSRAVFPLTASLLVTVSRQTAPTTFANSILPLSLLNSTTFIPGAVGGVAFGRFTSPNFLTPERFLPPTPTRTGTPQQLGENTLYFNLVIPAGPKPAAGWPVAIFGHGLPGDKDTPMLTVAASMAARGIATLTINGVGNGGGPLGTLRITSAGQTPVVIPAGGRAVDADGAGTYDAIRETSAAAPYSVVVSTDAVRQTVIDLMQLVRVVETGGIDYDGDGVGDLDAAHIYYFGHSWGGIYGSVFLGVEPSIRAGVLNSGGGGIGIVAELSPISRPLAGQVFAARTPSLSNATPFAAPLWGFNSNVPLRNQPVVIDTIPGAAAIREYGDRAEWAQQGGSPVAYAPYIRKEPLAGMQAKPILFQFGKGDQNVPNPAETGLLRAGDLADVATFYRTDLAVAANPTIIRNPHGLLLGAFNAPVPAARTFGRELQQQIADFFQSDGTIINDPDGTGPIFETPIPLPLPETTDFIP